MANALVGGQIDNNATVSGVTFYTAMISGTRAYPPGAGTEVQVQIASAAGTWSQLGIYIVSNSAGTATYKFRVAGANGNQAISVGSSATGWFTDASDSDTVTAGQKVNAVFANSANAMGVSTFQCVFAAGTGLISYYGGGALSISNNTLGNTFGSFGNWIGDNNVDGDNATIVNSSGEVSIQTKARAAGTLSNMAIYAVSGSQVLTLRKNTANGNETCGGSTGFQTDSTHTDSISSGDALDIATSNTAGKISIAYFEFTSSGTTFDMFTGMDGEGSYVGGDNATYYFPLTGNFWFQTVATNFQTEANGQTKWPFGVVTSNLRYRCFSPGGSTSVSVVMRKNGVTGNQAISLAAPAGMYEDASDMDSYAAGDKGNTMLNHGGVSQNIQLSQGAITVGPASSTETATVSMALTKLSFTIAEDDHKDTVTLALSEVAFSIAGALEETGAVALALSPISFVIHGTRKETATVSMALSAVAIAAYTLDLSSVSKLRQFHTFG